MIKQNALLFSSLPTSISTPQELPDFPPIIGFILYVMHITPFMVSAII